MWRFAVALKAKRTKGKSNLKMWFGVDLFCAVFCESHNVAFLTVTFADQIDFHIASDTHKKPPTAETDQLDHKF